MEAKEQCLICETSLTTNDVVEVTSRRRETLQKACRARGDQLRSAFQQSNLYIHESCYRSYTHSKNIQTSTNLKDTSSKTTRLSESESDLSAICLFCNNDASDAFKAKESKKPRQKRTAVSQITSEETLKNIQDKALTLHDEESAFIAALTSTINLKNINPRYHAPCFQHFFNKKSAMAKSTLLGDNVTQYIINHIEENKDECQFSLNKILQSYSGELPSIEYTIKKLNEYYGDKIIISKRRCKETIICFKDVGHRIMENVLYEQDASPAEKRKQIIEAAADIIIEDIRSSVYDVDNYPAPHTFLDNVESDIPQSLKMLVGKIILKNKKADLEK